MMRFEFFDSWRFAKQRADYFDYLQAVLLGSQGRLTVRELFARDAARYGIKSVRGRLSQLWARRCEASAGDLYATWAGSFPRDELALVRAAQIHGNARLLMVFQALSRHLLLLAQARDALWLTLGGAALAIVVVAVLLVAVPWWTVPSLQQAFNGMPQEYLGSTASSLFAFAALLKSWWIVLVMCLVVALAMGFYSLPRSHGAGRKFLDHYGPWRLYRQVYCMRLLALISILLQPGVGASKQLRAAVEVFYAEANPWLASYLLQTLMLIEQGHTDASAFDTGLLDKELYWYFEDMAAAQGLQPGLQAVHERMSERWLRRIKVQALALRWGVLLTGLAMVFALGLWHYAAIDDLRRSWMMFHAAG